MARHDKEDYAIARVLEAAGDMRMSLSKIEERGQQAFRQRLTGPRSGHVYTTRFFTSNSGTVVPYGVRAPHQASAPGEPPAYDTGELLRGVKVKGRRTPTGILVLCTSSADYGPYLEKGTSRMKPRPWFIPTMHQDIIPLVRKTVASGMEDKERRKARQLGGRG